MIYNYQLISTPFLKINFTIKSNVYIYVVYGICWYIQDTRAQIKCSDFRSFTSECMQEALPISLLKCDIGSSFRPGDDDFFLHIFTVQG